MLRRKYPAVIRKVRSGYSGPCFPPPPPEGIPVREIITATGMSRRWVFYRLQQMATEGLAVQVARGFWWAAP